VPAAARHDPLSPSGDRARRKIPWGDLVRALGFLRPYTGLTVVAFVSLLAVTAAQLITPQFIRLLIDKGIDGHSWHWIQLSTAGLLLMALARGLFNFLQGYLSEKASQGVAFDLRNLIFEKLQNLSFSYHDRAQTGQLMTRVTSDVENVRGYTGQGFLTLFSASITLVGTAVILFTVNWRLALVTLVTVPMIFGVLLLFVTRVFPLFGQIQRRLGALNSILQENLAGVAVVKGFAREPYELGRYETANQALLAQNERVVKALSASFPSVFLIANLGTLAVIWIGGDMVIGGSISLGTLVSFTTYLSFLLMPLFQLGFISAMLSRAGVSATRLFEVIDVVSEVKDEPGARPLGNVQGRVMFDRVSFRYLGGEQKILDDISFTVESGETVAIVGTTGSGKSTIINLIPRFYDVTGGAVRIDGVDVREVTLESLRSHIGIVLQESVLFGGTIRENIAYGRPDATTEQIERAARAAQAHDFIVTLPGGYDAGVGERGVTLSGGQRQRVAIARTLLIDPKVLILDDATSSVDAQTESRLQEALRALMQGRTSFVIAQRISTVRLADRILVLDQGRVVGQGTHDEVLCTVPLYGEIVDSQLLRDDAGADAVTTCLERGA
jgi:ATP-binding cassette, subfamily B, multidrug efflux pump